MKHFRYILFCTSLLFFVGCSEEDITVINTQITPNLSNPIVQKITNITWYRNLSTTNEEWVSLENIPKPSESMASMLYSLAWQNFTLYRDGTTNMVYVPPIFPYSYIHCRGTWQVSTMEENTIIISTKTPVSNANIKVKVLNLETKDQFSNIELSMDFGNRLLNVDFNNSEPEVENNVLEAYNYEWFASKSVLNDVIKEEDVIGAWASSSYSTEPLDVKDLAAEKLIRSVYLEDLLAQTPNLISGLLFNLQENGKAQLAYSPVIFNDIGVEENVVSDATWYIKGNKIWIDTEEEFFYSLGELAFGFTVHAPGLTDLGILNDTPIRTQGNRFYTIEIIEKKEEGFWCRITTNDAVFYAFLFESSLDQNSTTNIVDLIK